MTKIPKYKKKLQQCLSDTALKISNWAFASPARTRMTRVLLVTKQLTLTT